MEERIAIFEERCKLAEFNKNELAKQLKEKLDEINELNGKIEGIIRKDRKYDPEKDKLD